MGFSPPSLPCSLVSSLFNSGFGGHAGETLCVELLTLLGDTISWQNSLSSGFYTIYTPSYTMFHELQVQARFVAVSTGTRLHISHFDWLGFSVIVSMLQRELSFMKNEDYTYL